MVTISRRKLLESWENFLDNNEIVKSLVFFHIFVNFLHEIWLPTSLLVMNIVTVIFKSPISFSYQFCQFSSLIWWRISIAFTSLALRKRIVMHISLFAWFSIDWGIKNTDKHTGMLPLLRRWLANRCRYTVQMPDTPRNADRSVTTTEFVNVTYFKST